MQQQNMTTMATMATMTVAVVVLVGTQGVTGSLCWKILPIHNTIGCSIPKNERSSILPRFDNVGMQSIFPCHLGRKCRGRILGFTRQCIHSTSQSHKQCHHQNCNDDCDKCFRHSIHSRIAASHGLWQ